MKRLKEIIEGNYTVVIDTIEQFEIFTKVYSVLNNIRFDKFIYLHLEYSELVNYSFTSVVYLNTVKINASEIAECFFEKDCYYSCQTLDGTKYTFQFIKLEDNNLYVNQYTLKGYTEQDFKSQWDFSYNTNFKKITEQEAKGMETKEDLLEEAKRRYPIGTKFISLVPEDANMIREIKPYQGRDTVEFSTTNNVVRCKNGIYNGNGGCSHPYIYRDGKWAEIVEVTTESWQPKIGEKVLIVQDDASTNSGIFQGKIGVYEGLNGYESTKERHPYKVKVDGKSGIVVHKIAPVPIKKNLEMSEEKPIFGNCSIPKNTYKFAGNTNSNSINAFNLALQASTGTLNKPKRKPLPIYVEPMKEITIKLNNKQKTKL